MNSDEKKRHLNEPRTLEFISFVTCIPLYNAPSSFVKFTWLANRSEPLSWHLLVSLSWMGRKLYDKHRSSETHANWQDISDATSKSLRTLPLSFRSFIAFAKLADLKSGSEKRFEASARPISEKINRALRYMFLFSCADLVWDHTQWWI